MRKREMKIDWYDVVEKAEKAKYLADRLNAVSDLRRSVADRSANGVESKLDVKCSLTPAFISFDFDEVRFSAVSAAFDSFLAELEAYYAKEYEKVHEDLCGGMLYKKDGAQEPDFLSAVYEIPHNVYSDSMELVPFDTVDELIEHSGVTSTQRGKGSRPFIWLRNKEYGTDMLVTGYLKEKNKVVVGITEYNMSNLLNKFTFLDGSPCGKKEVCE